MKKTIKKIGNSLGIIFNKEECKIYNFKKEDIIELDDTVIIQTSKKVEGARIYFNLNNIPKEIKEFYIKESKRLNIPVEELLKRMLLSDAKKTLEKKK